MVRNAIIYSINGKGKTVFFMKLTLDIGGSKTRGFLYTESGSQKFEIRGGFGKAEDSETIEPELFTALQEILKEKTEKIKAVAVNLGGKNKKQITQTVENLCPYAQLSIHRESEGILARRIMEMHGANVLIMAGTGVHCFFFIGARQPRSGRLGQGIRRRRIGLFHRYQSRPLRFKRVG